MLPRFLIAVVTVALIARYGAAGEPVELKGHTSVVYSMQFSRDGKLLVTSGGDSCARLWDTAKGTELHKLSTGTSSYWGVGISHDGKLAAVPQNDGSIGIYDTSNGKVVHTLQGHTSSGYAADFSPDGTMLASTAADGLSKLWNLKTGKEITTLRHEKQTGSWFLAFANDNTVVVGDASGTVIVWDVKSKQAKLTFQAEQSGIWPIAVSPDGRTIATRVWQSTTVNFYETASGTKRGSAGVGTGGGVMMGWTGDNHRFFAGGAGGPMFYDLRTSKSTDVEKGERIIHAAATSHDGRWIAVAHDTGSVSLYDRSKEAKAKREIVPLKAEQLDKLLGELEENTEKHFTAIHRLSDAPEQALPALKKLLQPKEKPADLDEKLIAKYIKDLDHDRFAEREKAMKELIKMGPRVLPWIRKALMGDPSAEAKRRLEELAEKWDAKETLSRDDVRVIRVLEAIELTGTAEAKKILEETAKTHSGTWIGDEAKRAATRMRDR